ncbi:MAG: hypothetical protein U1E50_08780 [Caulobacteraceae bacterium]
MSGFDMTAANLGFAKEALFAGDAETARAILEPLAEQAPAVADIRYCLASARAATGDGIGASEALDDARTLHAVQLVQAAGIDVARCRVDGDYAARVASNLYSQHHVAVSSVIFGLAIQAGHTSQAGLLTYALALQHQGRAEEAIRVFKAADELYPSAAVRQFALYPHFMIENGPAEYAKAAREWADLYAPSSTEKPAFANRPLAGRKLRIGYVAPNFSSSQLTQFITPILESHDQDAVEIFLYPAKLETEQGWKMPMAIQAIGHLSDDDAAALIRSDQIDILVDCWGHSAGSRLAVFGKRCAPVQCAWINFVQTTGLSAMDYVLHADSIDAPGTAELFTETIWPIGPVFIPYRPAKGRLDPQPTPAFKNGYVTFGSFNHSAKLSHATVRAWGAILNGRPNSKLVLKYRYFMDPVLQRATLARFAAEGIAPDRIQFRGHSTGVDYLKEFADIDLALDPSPCPGGTTTCEALSNGVPLLTLKGPDFYSRIGVPSLIPLGLEELIAESWDDYIEKAIALSASVPALNALRARIRPAYDASVYCDDVGFTRNVEASFLAMARKALEGDAALAGAA